MKKINKKILILIMTLSIFIFTGIGIYAYYSVNSSQNVNITTDINDENVVEIASFDSLFENSKVADYNSTKKISQTSPNNSRIILKLTDDIELIDDLIITKDVHLNLNNHTLKLNDHRLTFKHGYAGCFNIFGGNISQGENGLGKIDIDLINGSVKTNNINYYSDETNTTTTTEENCINIVNINKKYTAYSALYLVANSIASDINKKVEFANYDTVIANDYDINQEKFITSKECSYNNASEGCSYIYKDIDLPMHYLSTDIEITYSSTKTNVISNYGKFTAPLTEEDVTLTVSIYHSSWDDDDSTTEDDVTCDFKLHAVNLSNSTVKNNVAKDLIKTFLAKYYVNGSFVVNEDLTISNYYEFTQGVQLPLNALDENITYTYNTTDINGMDVSTTSNPITESNAYSFEPNDECYHLVVRVNDSENLTLNMYSVYVSDNETIARLILNKLYGGAIIYDSSQTEKILTQYSELSSTLDEIAYGYVTKYNITGLTYSLKANSDVNTYFEYDSENYKLTVIDGQNPPPKTSYVTATFTFGTAPNAETVNVDLYLNYLAESGDTLSGFLPYYNLYDPMVNEELTTSFEMPFSFNGGAPYTCYDVAYAFEKHTTENLNENFDYYTYTLGKPTGLTISLYYNGATQITFEYNGTTSLTSQLNGYNLRDIASYIDAKYIFSLDVQNAAATNTEILLIYNYKFNVGSEWARYQYTLDETTYLTTLTSSTFTLSGGLFYDSSSNSVNAIHDTNFFAWIYNNFNPGNGTINSGQVSSTSFIPVDWLSLDVALDKDEDSSLSSVSDYYGIGNLTHITKVNLNGIQLSASLVTSIASMSSVSTLKLKGCSISDISSIFNMNSVKVLDVSNNSISDFSGLTNMESLEEVYLYGNNTSSTIIGSNGILNYQTYYDLIKDGIAVFNLESEGVPQLFGNSDEPNDYIRLKSIVYQDKLSSKQSIETLYVPFSNLTYSDFGLSNTGGDHSLTWSYESGKTVNTATYFMVTYRFTSNSTVYNLIVKYYVDRY